MDLSRNYRMVIYPDNIPHDYQDRIIISEFADSFTDLYNDAFDVSVYPIIPESESTTKQYLYPLFNYNGTISDFFYISLTMNPLTDYPEKATSFSLNTVYKETDNSYVTFGATTSNYNLMDSSSSGARDYFSYMSQRNYSYAAYVGITIFPIKNGYLFAGFSDRRGTSSGFNYSKFAAEQGISAYNILFTKCNLDDENKTISTVALYSDGLNVVKNVSKQVNPNTNKIVNGLKRYANAVNYGMSYGVMERYIGNVLVDDVYVLSMASGDIMQTFNERTYNDRQQTPYINNKLLINDNKYCFTTYSPYYAGRLAFLFDGIEIPFPYNSKWNSLCTIPGSISNTRYFSSSTNEIYLLATSSSSGTTRDYNYYIYNGDSWTLSSQYTLPTITNFVMHNGDLYIIYWINSTSPSKIAFARADDYTNYIDLKTYANATEVYMFVYNDDIYVFLRRTGSSGWIHLYVYNGQDFTLVTDSFPDNRSLPKSVTEHNGYMHVCTEYGIYELNGSSWSTLSNSPVVSSDKPAIISNNEYLHWFTIGSNNRHYVYDEDNSNWVKLDDYPTINIIQAYDAPFFINYNDKITTYTGTNTLQYLE